MQKKKKSKRKQTDRVLKKIIDIRAIILSVGAILFLPGIILKREVKDYLLNNDAIKKQAVIVNEENYWGNSPISHTFSYSYEFFVDSKRYRSDSRDEK